MSFTPEEKGKMLFALGYSIFEDDGPAMRAINSLDSKEAVAGPIIRSLLDKIFDVHEQLHKTIPLSKAVEDGSIKLRSHYTLDHLWRLGRSYVSQLATFTKISIFSDIFSPGGRARDASSFYSGDPSEDRVDPRGVPTR